MTLDDLERIAREASDSVPAPWNGRILALIAELRSARAVVAAAEALDERMTIGDHWGVWFKPPGHDIAAAQLRAAIDHHRTSRWATNAEQARNRRDTKLSAEDALTVVRLYAEGMRPKEIASRFSVSPNLVSQTVRRYRRTS